MELLFIVSFFLGWSSVEDWKLGTVGNYVWILAMLSFALYSLWTGDVQFWIGVIWYLGTGFLIAYMTELGGADVWALAVFGAGAWKLDPVAGLVLIAFSSIFYSLFLDKILDREIRLVPAFLIAYIILLVITLI